MGTCLVVPTSDLKEGNMNYDNEISNDADHYGRHDKDSLCRNSPWPWIFITVISPTMREARRHDWSWIGRHRDKGWPWQMTMERLERHLKSRELERKWRVAANRYLDGYGNLYEDGIMVKRGPNFDKPRARAGFGIGFGNPLRPTGVKLLELLDLPVGEHWEAIAAERIRKTHVLPEFLTGPTSADAFGEWMDAFEAKLRRNMPW